MGYLFRFTGVPIVGIRPPAMRRQRERGRSDRAFVVIDGRRHKLGVWGSEAAEQRYRELIGSQLKPKPKPVDEPPPACPSVNEILAPFMRYVLDSFADNPSEQWHYRTALRILKEEFGELPADQFGPRRLRLVREKMIAKGWGRNYVNAEINRIRRAFRWAASEERVGVEVHQALMTVEGLRMGRSAAPESPGVKPVSDEVIDATLPFLSEVGRDMVAIQRASGCRPGELCQLASKFIDRSGDVWLYTPPKHKTRHHGKRRVIAFGPKAQAVLSKYLFCTGEFFPYQTAGYRQLVRRACDKAFPAPDGLSEADLKAWRRAHRWVPLQIRHTVGTAVRAEFGLEGAQHVLGHSRADVTQIYAEKSEAQAKAIALKIG